MVLKITCFLKVWYSEHWENELARCMSSRISCQALCFFFILLLVSFFTFLLLLLWFFLLYTCNCRRFCPLYKHTTKVVIYNRLQEIDLRSGKRKACDKMKKASFAWKAHGKIWFMNNLSQLHVVHFIVRLAVCIKAMNICIERVAA